MPSRGSVNPYVSPRRAIRFSSHRNIVEGSRLPPAHFNISIVVATKTNLLRLQRFMQAVLALDLQGTEIIVVDGGSRDGTVEWLKSLRASTGRGDVVVISEVDTSIAEAWNRGVRIARGNWFLFLGDDDFIIDTDSWKAAEGCLSSLPPECGIAAFPVRVVTLANAIVSDVRPRIGDQGMQFPAVNAIPHQAAFHRRSLWATHGPFDESFAIAADYEFLLRVHAAGIDMRVCDGPPPVAMTFGGASKRSPLANLREFRRAQRMHGIVVPLLQRCREWCFAALRHVVAATCGEPFARRWADRARRLRGLPPVWEVP
jgi:glycosyltransferase involved in cell wall biosynthesis